MGEVLCKGGAAWYGCTSLLEAAWVSACSCSTRKHVWHGGWQAASAPSKTCTQRLHFVVPCSPWGMTLPDDVPCSRCSAGCKP